MSDHQTHGRAANDTSPQPLTPRMPLLLQLFRAACLLVGALLLVPAVYYIYLGINPPEAAPGDLYFGDGVGLIIGAIPGALAIAALATGTLVPAGWRRRQRTVALIAGRAGNSV